MRVRRALAVAGWVTAGLATASELFFRIRYRKVLWMHVYPQVYVPDADLGYRYRPNSPGVIRISSIHRRFRINELGFPGSDFSATKPPGVFRIAVVGASNTTGIWMHGRGRTYCELLEEHMRRSGREVEILNFGIDGRFRAVHQLRLIERQILGCQADLVLMDIDLPFVTGTFERDVYKGHVLIYNPEAPLSRQWCQWMVDRITKHAGLIRLYRASYSVRAAARYYMTHARDERAALLTIFFENRVQSPDIIVLPWSVKRSVEALQATRDQLRAAGATLLLFQYWENPYQEGIFRKYGLEYMQLDVPPTGDMIHDCDGHYRQKGHTEIGRQLFERLKPWVDGRLGEEHLLLAEEPLGGGTASTAVVEEAI